jgi:hypothetical protein
MTALVRCSLLGGVAFGDVGLLVDLKKCWIFCIVLVVLVLLLEGIYHCSGAFFNSSSF